LPAHKEYTFSGSSMQPTIEDQNKMIVNLSYYEQNPVKRGDIIVFNVEENISFIKRVVGLPNETIQIKDGTIYNNGQPINGKYVFSDIGPGEMPDSVKIGENEYFVIGDNAPNSRDSREFGAIKKEDIVGKVVEIKSNK
jgi:signal peptidase I